MKKITPKLAYRLAKNHGSRKFKDLTSVLGFIKSEAECGHTHTIIDGDYKTLLKISRELNLLGFVSNYDTKDCYLEIWWD